MSDDRLQFTSSDNGPSIEQNLNTVCPAILIKLKYTLIKCHIVAYVNSMLCKITNVVLIYGDAGKVLISCSILFVLETSANFPFREIII